MTYDDVAEITEMLKHPCYRNTQLRAYIATPLLINNRIWGTLNFSSLKPKQPAFTQADYQYVESLALRVSHYLRTESILDAETAVTNSSAPEYSVP